MAAPSVKRIVQSLWCCLLVLVLSAGPGGAAGTEPPGQAPPAAPSGETGAAQDEKGELSFEAWLALAEKGDPEAQCNVGVFYLNGEKVPQNWERALAWLTSSARQDFGHAQYLLADLYSRGGRGIPMDGKKAYFFAVLAAAAKDAPETTRLKAIKIREWFRDRLSPADMAKVQSMADAWQGGLRSGFEPGRP